MREAESVSLTLSIVHKNDSSTIDFTSERSWFAELLSTIEKSTATNCVFESGHFVVFELETGKNMCIQSKSGEEMSPAFASV
jgi:hypothetical protein